MERKSKIIVSGLSGLLLVLLIFIFQLNAYRAAAILERNDLKKENESLIAKVNQSLQENSKLEQQASGFRRDLDTVSQQKSELEIKYQSVLKEREELAEKLKKQPAPVYSQPQAVSGGAGQEDAYWARMLKEKTDLEMQIEAIRSALKDMQVKNEDLVRDKTNLSLELSTQYNEERDLRRQLEYNQKLVDGISQELVREKNDKFQMHENLKSIQDENHILKRQLKALNNNRISLENKLMDLRGKDSDLEKRFTEMGKLLGDRTTQIVNLNKQLEAARSGEVLETPKEESVELPAIVVRPQGGLPVPGSSKAPAVEGKVLTVKRENNFVVVDLGEDAGVKIGDTFRVYRDGKQVADLEAIQVRKNVSACDIKKENSPIKPGDIIR